jgi:hypothetical protein
MRELKPESLRTLGRENFYVLQEFEGTVLSLTHDSFFARLVDKTNPGPEEEAEFPMNRVVEVDRELVQPGAIFEWRIGCHEAPDGKSSRASMIRFRRMPVWTAAEIERAERRAESLLSHLGINEVRRIHQPL